MSKYIIWDKKSQVIVPSGKVFTKDEWMEQYPMAKLDTIDLVLNGSSPINGAICNEYNSFINVYKESGCDFSGCKTKQDFLDKIEIFEDERRAEQIKIAQAVTPEERIASALEFQNAMQGGCPIDIIKQNFSRGLWDKKMVETCVGFGLISKTEFQNITKTA